MHVGQIIAFVNYMTQILASLMMITFVFTSFVRAKASAERVGEVMKRENNEEEIELSKVKFETNYKKIQIEFSNVYFSYAASLILFPAFMMFPGVL